MKATEYRSAQTGTFDFVSRVGRVLDNSSTQLSPGPDYDGVGILDHTVDPVGRQDLVRTSRLTASTSRDVPPAHLVHRLHGHRILYL